MIGELEETFNVEMGRKLRLKRRERGITQIALAAEIGCHRNTVNRWEMWGDAIPMWMLLRACDILGCNHVALLPAREFTWGADYAKLLRERDPDEGIQAERDLGTLTNGHRGEVSDKVDRMMRLATQGT